MSDGTDSGKRTVAELIAKYGDQGSSASRRRHRRRAEDTNETAPQAIIDRVRSDSGYFAPAQPEPTHHNGMDRPAASAPEPAQPNGWRDRLAGDPREAQQKPVGAQQESARLDSPPNGRPRFGRPQFGGPPAAPLPARRPAQQPPPAPTPLAQPPSVPKPMPMAPVRSDLQDDRTIRLPDSANPARGGTGFRPAPAAPSPAGLVDDDATVTQTIKPSMVGRPAAAELESESELSGEIDDLPANPFPDDIEQARVPPAKPDGWLEPALLIGAGVIAGALVWLLFDWLWAAIPTVAVIAALLVIAGLVVAVRMLRRATDVQTTVLAAVVGVIVAVSPAAMLLLRR